MHRWNPYLAPVMRELVVGRSPQAEVVARFLRVDKIAAEAQVSESLNGIWEALRDSAIIERVYPNEFQLSWERLLVSTAGPWFTCNRCGMMTAHSVRGACVMTGCGGRLSAMSADEIAARFGDHHWYNRYTQTTAFPVEVREHTAQLTTALAGVYKISADFGASHSWGRRCT